MSSTSSPHYVYTVEQIRQIEHDIVEKNHYSLYALMEKAGLAVFQHCQRAYPHHQHWLILCGAGNNGGDGFVIARLAKQHNIHVTVIHCPPSHSLPDEATLAQRAWQQLEGTSLPADAPWPEDIDLIIDGLFGIGLNRAPTEPYATLITQANNHPAPIVAIDTPSGLLADTGEATPHTIIAAHTVTMIGVKLGLLTGQARNYVGQLHCCELGLKDFLIDYPTSITRQDHTDLGYYFQPRSRCAHKGLFGKIIAIGGDLGYGGAIRLAGEAALRSGAGLVKVLTQERHLIPILTACPELMVNIANNEEITQSLHWADTLIIGPGLGRHAWGSSLIQHVQHNTHPAVWDADALYFLAQDPKHCSQRIITPHPAEAARLLHCTIPDIESNRLIAAKTLVETYGGVVVLKGAGTIITDGQHYVIADVGNPGMATAGMGDVLSGIIGALLGQKLSLFDAACAGCLLHGTAADKAAEVLGEKSLMARDVIEYIAHVLR